MSLSVQALDLHETRALLASQLKCRGPFAALRAALIADHMRTLVWAPFRAPAIDFHPAHTSRLFAALDRNVRFLSSETAVQGSSTATQHSEYEFVRDQLERCGDIVHIGNGYWIPGPVRAVRPVMSQSTIVVGGAPTAELKRTFSLHSIGPARYLFGERSAEGGHPEVSVGVWLGISESLSAWTEKTLAWGRTQLQPQAEIEDDSIEIYAPDMHRARRRPGFWIDAKEFQEAAPTVRLFRPKMSAKWTFDRPDYLGVFNSGPDGAQLSRSVRISKDVGYRLQFGLDQKLAVSRTITLKRIGDAHSLDLKFALPEPETRVLGLAWRNATQESEQFFDSFALPALNEVAVMLGIRVLLT
jgi:hypothetical protein